VKNKQQSEQSTTCLVYLFTSLT